MPRGKQMEDQRMHQTLPGPIAGYFAADNAGGDVAAHFTPEGVVIDEGATHRGAAEIGAWKQAAQAKYNYRSEVTGVEADGSGYLVTCHVTGDFPGGEVDLRYRFTLAGGQIARLEIAP
ncbi:MAG: nuclear transport factor 2 family protein [Vannielia sp.]|uniref:nuclear transport factor 2 family protein n=1 Tax=Vannielia sp. TaxID=2813045 RepID=UPI003B8E3519